MLDKSDIRLALREFIKTPSATNYTIALAAMNAYQKEYANRETALAAAREFWGRDWRNRLRQSWETGKYPASLGSHVAYLQCIRNSGYRL